MSILLFFCGKSALGFSFRIHYCMYSFVRFSFVQDETLVAVDSLAGYSFDAIATAIPSAGPERHTRGRRPKSAFVFENT